MDSSTAIDAGECAGSDGASHGSYSATLTAPSSPAPSHAAQTAVAARGDSGAAGRGDDARQLWGGLWCSVTAPVFFLCVANRCARSRLSALWPCSLWPLVEPVPAHVAVLGIPLEERRLHFGHTDPFLQNREPSSTHAPMRDRY